MFKNYLKIALRNIRANKVSSFINIGGLAVGMAVSMMIGLWIWDEISFDHNNKNYTHIAKVLQNQTLNGDIATWSGLPWPTAAALRNNFSSDLKTVSLVLHTTNVVSTPAKSLNLDGAFMEEGAPAMFDLDMLKGAHTGLQDAHSILLSESFANAFFGSADVVGKLMKIDTQSVKITGVYKDMPANSAFANINFIAPWQLFFNNSWAKTNPYPWGSNAFEVYVQLADNADMQKVSAKIRDVKLNNVRPQDRVAKPALFLHPMSRWHLYSEFKNGINTGGRIQFVWLFGIIGIFVLLLACINFMNLSTALSQKRAKEVGIRKAVGSLRMQLIGQFLNESIVTAVVAFIVAIGLVQLSLPYFNNLSGKAMQIPAANLLFWLSALGFAIVTGLIAGSYPAFYLSAFNTVKVLKGHFRAGRFSAVPRKVLVVTQFSVSIILIISTIIVFRQIQFAKNRPVGYSRANLISMQMHTTNIHDHFDAVKNELKNTGAIVEMAEARNPLTAIWNSNGGMVWRGKPKGLSTDFPMCNVTYDYGKTIGWQIIEGRDFSRQFSSVDSSTFILNESAVKYMGLKHPIGEKIAFDDGVSFTVVGVVKDFIIESPYAQVRPTMFRIARNGAGIVNIKLNPALPTKDALAKIETVFKKFNPQQPFDYTFVDAEYAKKFSDDERTGNLAAVFSVLAIFISCLGLFGLASFIAEQRTKEIGVRKVLGASVFSLWQLMSREFVLLVAASCLIAIPVAVLFMQTWLQQYQYRTSMSAWIFIISITGVLLITLCTVSFQSIKAALANPVKSLRTE